MSEAAASQSIDTRVSRNFVRRLRREQTAAAFGNAVAKQILTAQELQFDGREIVGFHIGPAAHGRSEAEIERLLRQVGKQCRVGDAKATFHEAGLPFDFNDGLTSGIGAEAEARTARPLDPQFGRIPFKEHKQNDLREKLLPLIRQLAAPLRAQDVATVLVVAQALARNGTRIDEVLAILRLEQPIISICCPIEGFERSFLDLLERGSAMPGKVTRSNGYDAYARLKVVQTASSGARWQFVCFGGKKYDAENLHSNVSRAVEQNCPIVCVAESFDLMPSKLVTAAHLNLSCGPLNVEVICATIRTVLGEIAPESLSGIDCSKLELANIAIAVRPGNSPQRAAELLAQLASENRKSQADECGGEAASDAFREQKSPKTCRAWRDFFRWP